MKNVIKKTFVLFLCICNLNPCVFAYGYYDWSSYFWLKGEKYEEFRKEMATTRALRKIAEISGPNFSDLDCVSYNDKVERINNILESAGTEKLYFFLGKFFDCIFKKQCSRFLEPREQWCVAKTINPGFVREKVSGYGEDILTENISTQWLDECIEGSGIMGVAPASNRDMAASTFIFESFYYMSNYRLVDFFCIVYCYFFNTRFNSIPELFEDVYPCLYKLTSIAYYAESNLKNTSCINQSLLYRKMKRLEQICDPQSPEFRKKGSINF